MSIKSKDLLGLQHMEPKEIEFILHTTRSLREIVDRPTKKLPTLRGKSVINMFYEPSTRTRSSFELAGKYLGADVVNVTASSSSVVKGESLIDTGRTLEAMGVNIVVIRHPQAGAPQFLA